MELTLAELRLLPSTTMTVTMECAGNGRARLMPRPVSQPWLGEAVGTAAWHGTPLGGVLDLAGVLDDAVEVVCTGLDRGVEGGVEQVYARSLSLADARSPEVLLAYEMNAQPLLPQHGFPLRLLVPGWYGMTNVKWLSRIEVVAEPFDGYQQRQSYRLRASVEEPGTPVSRMLPRALMIPPGIPEFLTRRRFLETGSHRVEGRAWSGHGAVSRVEVSTDGGATWRDAQLGDELSAFAWRHWWFTWEARIPGEHVVCCRATDTRGLIQPLEPTWNAGGYENNAVQRVLVTVGDRAV
jgi:DMSO/TMAO reductase YedYZ molybdopterin-dependent catalytic subunit